MRTLEKIYDFLGAADPPTAGSPNGTPFVEAVTNSATVSADAGYMKLALDTTLENQVATLYQDDELIFDIDNLLQVDIWAKLSSAALHAAVSFGFGLASARNADLDLLAAACLFRGYGSNAIVCESDDGTNDNDDVATGLTLGTTVKRFTIDFAAGVKTLVPPPSSGGKGNVLFSMDDANGNLRPVCRSTRFNMENYSSGLQLIAQIQKGAASSVIDTTPTGSLYIQKIRVVYRTD